MADWFKLAIINSLLCFNYPCSAAQEPDRPIRGTVPPAQLAISPIHTRAERLASPRVKSDASTQTSPESQNSSLGFVVLERQSPPFSITTPPSARSAGSPALPTTTTVPPVPLRPTPTTHALFNLLANYSATAPSSLTPAPSAASFRPVIAATTSTTNLTAPLHHPIHQATNPRAQLTPPPSHRPTMSDLVITVALVWAAHHCLKRSLAKI